MEHFSDMEPEIEDTYKDFGYPEKRGVLNEYDEARIREMEAKNDVKDGGKNFAARKDLPGHGSTTETADTQ